MKKVVSEFINEVEHMLSCWDAPSSQSWNRASKLFEEARKEIAAQCGTQAATVAAVPSAAQHGQPEICQHAELLYSRCKCTIKNSINSEMYTCDGKGQYTVVKNLGYEYSYQCGKSAGKLQA
jgi:hypothetical protein